MAMGYFAFLLLVLISSAEAQLSPEFYSRACPTVLPIIKSGVTSALKEDMLMGASLLRLNFHDCFVNGCDGSILLDDTSGLTGEKTAPPNLSLRGFEVIDKIKSTLETACPGVVSCADILTVVARDSVVSLGGPSWDVSLGRRDSTTASKDAVAENIPSPTLDLADLIAAFSKKGLTPKDLVVLSGSHTIGQARCATFRTRIYNESNILRSFAAERQRTCPSSGGDGNLAPLDIVSSRKFDNEYFKDLIQRKGLLHSDQQLYSGQSTDSLVRAYASDLGTFKADFAEAMIKLGNLGAVTGNRGQVYIVYMGSLPNDQIYIPSSHHVSLLQKIAGQSFSEKLIVRSYKRSFNGFAAKLTHNEAQDLSRVEGVVSVFPDKNYKLLTTRSWDFLGLSETISRKPQLESNVIIGLIDSGIWPELASFSDEGFGPPPITWKGACKGGNNFTCNNKVIGARYYGSLNTTRDDVGHGSHTASIAAGVSVKDTSFYGLAQGTVRGGAPLARIVAYKICDSDNCASADILAAFDDAIADGVDIISVSLGFDLPIPLDKDVIAIGAFHAMAAGILTSAAAGNSGNTFGSTSSLAPWLFSVAASSTDRRIIDKVILGNGKTIVGLSINSFDLNGTMYPLVDFDTTFKHSYKGEIIAQQFGDYSVGVDYDAVGNIYFGGIDNDFSIIEPQPGAALSGSDLVMVKSYLNSSKAPVATILRSEAIVDHTAPVVASFSSRGPNSFIQEIMKPDVTAPGVDILAGYSPIVPVTDTEGDNRHVQYSILSGTSMSCPHVSGIAAYIKSFHPTWSPSAIKSAIMTTAIPLNATTNPQGEFAYGSGQVNPVKATDPGLVYEALKEDYIKLLCRIGFDEKKLGIITGDNSTCPKGGKTDLNLDFNYPSLTAKVNQNASFTLKFQRIVTNVGQANSTYQAKVLSSTPDLEVKVEPKTLSFRSLNEQKSFNVTVSGKDFSRNLFKSAALVWFDGVHSVRTPIVVHTIDAPALVDNVDGRVSR